MPVRQDLPVIIEVALNGATSRTINPNVPLDYAVIDAEALACAEAGAAIVHSHVEPNLYGERAADAYMKSWEGTIAARPDLILCPTSTASKDMVEKWSHVPALARRGAISMGVLDPGATTLWDSGEDGLPDKRATNYVTPHAEIDYVVDQLHEYRLGPSIAIYEPNYLRVALAYERAGRLPAGTLVKLYFGGDHNWFSGRKTGATFGLPATLTALEAYLEMMERSALAWSVAVIGGDCVGSGMARWALERGGHVRVGLEDHVGSETPTNLELVRALTALCEEVGRPIASSSSARQMLHLPSKLDPATLDAL